MTTNEIISLIDKCAERKVLNFKLDGLEFSFGLAAEPERTAPLQPVDPKVEQEAIEELAEIARQTQLDNLRLSDPLQYEQLIAENQLEQPSEDLSA